MKSRWVWAGVLAVAGLVVSSDLATAESTWSELRGKQFVLRARVGLKDGAAIICEVDRVARMLGAMRANDSMSTGVPAIVVVDNERDTRDLLPDFWEHYGARPLGAYWSGLYGHHIVVRVDAKADERFHRILHEYAHFATRVAYANPPRWVDEGISELLENATVVGDEIEVGRPVAAHVKTLRSRKNWIPVKELTSASALPKASDRAKLPIFYAEAWALVHYLALRQAPGHLDPKEIAQGHLPTDQELQQYSSGQELRTVKIPAAQSNAAGCGSGAIHQLPEIELLTANAQALADGPRPEVALPLLRRALLIDPENIKALETLGFVHFVGNRPAEAAATFDRVIASGSASHISYFYRAVLADRIPERAAAAGRVPVADYLQWAVRLSPEFEPARERLQQLQEHP